jgi:hypothetical protein
MAYSITAQLKEMIYPHTYELLQQYHSSAALICLQVGCTQWPLQVHCGANSNMLYTCNFVSSAIAVLLRAAAAFPTCVEVLLRVLAHRCPTEGGLNGVGVN